MRTYGLPVLAGYNDRDMHKYSINSFVLVCVACRVYLRVDYFFLSFHESFVPPFHLRRYRYLKLLLT